MPNLCRATNTWECWAASQVRVDATGSLRAGDGLKYTKFGSPCFAASQILPAADYGGSGAPTPPALTFGAFNPGLDPGRLWKHHPGQPFDSAQRPASFLDNIPGALSPRR
jgi:hypothetical protein